MIEGGRRRGGGGILPGLICIVELYVSILCPGDSRLALRHVSFRHRRFSSDGSCLDAFENSGLETHINLAWASSIGGHTSTNMGGNFKRTIKGATQSL